MIFTREFQCIHTQRCGHVAFVRPHLERASRFLAGWVLEFASCCCNIVRAILSLVMPTIDVPQAELFSSLGRPYSELFLSKGLWTDKSLAAFRINKNAHYHLCSCKICSRPENHLRALALRPRFCISSIL